jgi:phage tail-like protein
MASKDATRNDPLPAFCFKVSLDFAAGADLFFKSVSGIRYEVELLPVREGGVNDTTWQLPGSVKWANLVFKQGFTSSSLLLQYRDDWMSMSPSKMIRTNGTIFQLDTALNAVGQWDFVGGFPVKWDLSEMDAAKSELAIETLEIAHHGLTYTKLI